ncbi:MAG TPA: hypothetical protein DD426_12245 [Clostridiaceae bacterium]|nr:hypothetical protein [Clostridiaceae bacterium]
MKNKRIIAVILSVLLVLPTAAYAKDKTCGIKGNTKKSSQGIQIKQTVKKLHNVFAYPKNKTNGIKLNRKKAVQGIQIKQTVEKLHDVLFGKTGKLIKNEQEQAKKEIIEKQNEEKKKQIEDFKNQIKAKHETMKQLQEKIKEQKQLLQQKKTELESILNDIKSGKKTLTSDMLSTLLSKAQILKTDINNIEGTASYKDLISDTQGKLNKKDFNNALSSLDKVIQRMSQRFNALVKLNLDLEDVLKVLRQAPATAPSTGSSVVATN